MVGFLAKYAHCSALQSCMLYDYFANTLLATATMIAIKTVVHELYAIAILRPAQARIYKVYGGMFLQALNCNGPLIGAVIRCVRI
eukprot:5749-Heterococcus_DN1.PRE.2